ncbi:MAG: Amidase [Solirubrobacterales bacterium]|nr:Amidase [Solirubrobacterales bacterium]
MTRKSRGRVFEGIRVPTRRGSGQLPQYGWLVSQLGPTSNALDLAAALRARELSAVELLNACLAAVDERNPELNAVVWRDDEAARTAARDADTRIVAGEKAPFLGVPIPIKDLTPVAGWPVAYGSAAAPEGVSEESELVVESLLRAGFVLCGRTNAPEFGPITVAENDRYGISRNPWDTSRSPGGSSGGAAAAVAGGMFPIAHANDGGGSIRIPSAYCGLVGLKSSRARVPRRAQAWMGAVVEGVTTRTVADAATVLDLTAGPDPLAWNNAIPPARPFAEELGADPGRLRIGLMAEAPLGIPTAPDCVDAARDTAALLEELGHELTEVEVATISAELVPAFTTMAAAGLADYDGVDWERVEPHNRHSYKAATEDISSYEYVVAAQQLERISRREVARWGRDFDVMLTPTSAILPPLAGAILEAQHAAPEQATFDVVASVVFAAFGNVTGLPSISLPLYWNKDGLPVGTMLTGAPFDEATLIRLGAQLEAARPWAERIPTAASA